MTRGLKIDTLHGQWIQLEPIVESHREELRPTADYEEIWRYMPNQAIAEGFNPWFEECLDKMVCEEQITYVLRDKQDQCVLGATAYYNIQLENKSLALGYSWHRPDLWGSTINPEAKFLMLSQAFEHWNINRIEMGTDSRNSHSYNAIKKLGATEEGRLRQHMILHDGAITDTIVFSILSSEWPTIKKQLIQRISSHQRPL